MFWRSAFRTSEFFSGDIDRRRLAYQLSMMQDVCNRKGSKVSSIIGALAALEKAENCFLKFSHCYSCITFCQHRRRATSEDLSWDNNDADGLNNLMTLHVHKDMSDALDAVEIAREFVIREPRRCQVFGTDFWHCLPLHKPDSVDLNNLHSDFYVLKCLVWISRINVVCGHQWRVLNTVASVRQPEADSHSASRGFAQYGALIPDQGLSGSAPGHRWGNRHR